MTKIFETASGVALYADFERQEYQTSDLQAVLDALKQDLKGTVDDVIMAQGVMLFIERFKRVGLS